MGLLYMITPINEWHPRIIFAISAPGTAGDSYRIVEFHLVVNGPISAESQGIFNDAAGAPRGPCGWLNLGEFRLAVTVGQAQHPGDLAVVILEHHHIGHLLHRGHGEAVAVGGEVETDQRA